MAANLGVELFKGFDEPQATPSPGNMPGITAQLSESEGYYWLNASWVVSFFSGTFAYLDDGVLKKTANLVDVMRMLNGDSSLYLGTIVIAYTNSVKMESDLKVTTDRSSYGLSVKLRAP
jgi:hypothetical protein